MIYIMFHHHHMYVLKIQQSRIMLYVIIALLPTTLFGIYNFGYQSTDFNFSNNRKLCCIRVDLQ